MLHSIRPGCKINLTLYVTGTRADGYHNLSSLFYHLSTPSDEIIWEDHSEVPGIKFSCDQTELENQDNLVYRAAYQYATTANLADINWNICLKKNVPMAAGLGGGSADAGGILRLLNQHYNRLTPEELHKLAAGLGADVPFFLYGQTAVASGIGDELVFITAPKELHGVLVAPRFPVSAKWAYQHLRNQEKRQIPTPESWIKTITGGDIFEISAMVHNDFREPLLNKFPLLTELRQTLLGYGAKAAEISGSGPTLFALSGSLSAAAMLAGQLKLHTAADKILKIFVF